MKVDLIPRTQRCIVAVGLLLGAVAVHAASGVTVTPDKESMVNPGMSAEEVRQTLGRPALVKAYRNEPGPTWIYYVKETGPTQVLFEVDFANNGQVASVDQREVPRH